MYCFFFKQEVSSYAQNNSDGAVDGGHCISRGRGFTAFTDGKNSFY